MRPLASAVLVAVLALLPLGSARAVQWQEPWQAEVITQSEVLVRVAVLKVEARQAEVRVLKRLAGAEVSGTLRLAGYHALRGQGLPEDQAAPWIEAGREYYLYLKRAKDGAWQLPTPSSGIDDVLDDGDIAATFRYSAERVALPVGLYELLLPCVFAARHGQGCRDPRVGVFVRDVLGRPAARFDPEFRPDETRLYYRQHAALETAALIGPVGSLDLADLNTDRMIATLPFPNQAALLRVWGASGRPQDLARVTRFLCDRRQVGYARAIGLRVLREREARSEAGRLKACLRDLVADDLAWPGTGVTDPRVPAGLPFELQPAAESLLRDWATR